MPPPLEYPDGTVRDRRAGLGRRIVLVGLGHAHLLVAARAARFRAAGLYVTLIDEGAFWYSSIGSGLLAGRYERDDDVVEAEPFARGCGIAFVRGRAARIDRDAREVVLTDGGRVPYDIVSLNVGSRVDPPFPVAGENIWGPKPIDRLLDLRERMSASFAAGETVRWLTVGGNHSGAELTLNALALVRTHGARMEATLVTEAPELVTGEPPGARRAMREALGKAGCRVVTGTRVAELRNGIARFAATEDGEAPSPLSFEYALVATGLSAAPLVTECDLPADVRDGLHVTPELHAPDDPRVFASGDCASILGYDLPKVGVFGVRASPVLARNLIAAATGRPLRRYRPQPIWFAAQNLGDGTGLASWGPVWWRGRSALALKDWNDRRFMRLYQQLEVTRA